MVRRISLLLVVTMLLAACGTTPPPQGPVTPQGGTAAGRPTLPPGYPGPGGTPGVPEPATPSDGTPDSTPYPSGTGAPPAGAPIPAACVPQDDTHAAYFDLAGNYCLLYPAGFSVRDQRPGPVGIFGPALDPSAEPVQATLTILVEPANGRSLQQVIDEIVATAGSSGPVTRTEMTLGGVPAVTLSGMSGRTGNEQILVVQGERVYRLALFPVDPGFPQAQPDIEKLRSAVLRSFTFLTGDFAVAYAACPAGTEAAAPYVNPFAGYCFLYSPNTSITEAPGAAPVTTLSGPAREPGPEPLRPTLSISSSQSANGRDVEQVVTDYLASFPAGGAAVISRTASTIAGQPAIILDGVPARLPARQAFIVYGDRVVEFTLQPFRDPAFQQYQEEVDALWQQVTGSLVLIPAP